MLEDALIGSSLGPYRIVAPIGQGGMATVYKAHHAALDRLVALKVLSPHLAHDPDFSERFRREALAIAQLAHPNILPIHDFGQQDGLAYIVTQFVPGGTLQERVGSSLPLAWSINICAQVALALDHAHAANIVHRDVKPANILLTVDDWALLADFGISKMLGSSVGLTGTGIGVGTPSYLSPEQAQGLAVDGRSDIYALGMTLYEMLVGRVAFPGETPLGVILKQISDPVPSLREFRPDLPPEVDLVIQKALAKNPEDRFATAGLFVDALEAAGSGSTVPNVRLVHSGPVLDQGPPTAANEEAIRPTWKRRPSGRPLAAMAGAAACLILIAAGLIGARLGDGTPTVHGESSARAGDPTSVVVPGTPVISSVLTSGLTVGEAPAADAEPNTEMDGIGAVQEGESRDSSLEAAIQAAVQLALAGLPSPTPPPTIATPTPRASIAGASPQPSQAPATRLSDSSSAPGVGADIGDMDSGAVAQDQGDSQAGDTPPNGVVSLPASGTRGSTTARASATPGVSTARANQAATGSEVPGPTPRRESTPEPVRLTVEITQADCSSVSGMVTTPDGSVRDYLLSGAASVTGGSTRVLGKEVHVPGPEFHLDFPSRLPHGSSDIRVYASKTGLVTSAAARTTVSC